MYMCMKSSFAKNDKWHFKKNELSDVHYSPHIWTQTFFVKKASISTFKASRVHVLLQKLTSAPCCFWTEADKSILANQCAVFRSGDKATFTWKDVLAERSFIKLTKSDRGWIISTNLMNLWYLLQGEKLKRFHGSLRKQRVTMVREKLRVFM